MQNDLSATVRSAQESSSVPRISQSSQMPDGVRIFALARSIRWLGWGFGEPLLPVFIMAFSHTFAEAGLLSSTVEIVSLISLPIIGIWADRIPAKRLVIWSLLLYPLVGLGYFFAGFFKLAIFIVIARAINGFTWELENVGIATYYRRVSEHRRIATSFGYLDTLTNFAWIAAAVTGMFLVAFVPIYDLLLAVAPFSIFAFFIAIKGPKDSIDSKRNFGQPKLMFFPPFEIWREWIERFWLIGALTIFSSIINSLITFFIPITAYLAGAKLSNVVLIAILGAIPCLFGFRLGILADRFHRYRLASIGLIFAAVIAICLSQLQFFWLKLCSVFLLGVAVELFSVIQCSLITTLGAAETYGKRGSVFEGISTLGDLTAPIILGIVLDLIGFRNVTLAVGVVAIILAILFRFKK